jgi:hypothetical protein
LERDAGVTRKVPTLSILISEEGRQGSIKLWKLPAALTKLAGVLAEE